MESPGVRVQQAQGQVEGGIHYRVHGLIKKPREQTANGESKKKKRRGVTRAGVSQKLKCRGEKTEEEGQRFLNSRVLDLLLPGAGGKPGGQKKRANKMNEH